LLVRANGERFEGEFKQDTATGKQQVFYNDGRYYIGTLKEFKRDGRGRLYYTTNQTTQQAITEGGTMSENSSPIKNRICKNVIVLK
jgi:hypothetical protein